MASIASAGYMVSLLASTAASIRSIMVAWAASLTFAGDTPRWRAKSLDEDEVAEPRWTRG